MKKCPHCNDPGTIKRGRSLYCVRHSRFHVMRHSAKRDGKEVPARDWLETNVPEGMVCPCCARQMNWKRGDGGSTVITLQHDRDGGMRLICQGCNTRHATMPGDSFYSVPAGMKKCSTCGKVSSAPEFHKSVCKPCHAAWFERYREVNREKLAQAAAQYCFDNRERIAARRATYYAANREKILASNARRHALKKRTPQPA